jgi:hypothetical protein
MARYMPTLVLGFIFYFLTGGISFAAVGSVRGGSDGCGGIPLQSTSLGLTVGDPGSAGSIPFMNWTHSLASNDPGSVGGIPTTARGLRSHVVDGGPDGVGGIPYTGNPAPSNHLTVPYAPTVGLIIDSTNSPIARTPILILSFDGTVIAATTTDSRGAFAVQLPKISGLTLVLPTLDVFDIPITAGDPVLVLVP